MDPAAPASHDLASLLEEERRLREKSEAQTREIEQLLQTLMERQLLLAKLSKIQASISHRQPLQDVLDSITEGAKELLGDEVVGIRLLDHEDPEWLVLVSSCGVPSHIMDRVERTPASQGAGGEAMFENRLVVYENYSGHSNGLKAFSEVSLQTAMAAPVHENGRAIGSLVVASYDPTRTYTMSEKEILLAFAEHASMALTDAKTVEAMREAQRTRDMFLAMMSHELKTPLTVITGTLHTLVKRHATVEPDVMLDMLTSAKDRAKDLQNLIEHLLHGTAAGLASSTKKVSVWDLVLEAVRGFENTRNVDVVTVPVANIEVDTSAVYRLFGGLIENAVAHSPSDSGLWVGAELDEEGMALWVENEGFMTVEERASIFEPFRRGEGVRSSGVGLGLYIARQTARGLGGTLDVDCHDGRVRFTAVIPVSVVEPHEPGEMTLTKNP